MEEDSQPVIALIDDDRHVLETVSIALEAEGFAVRVYADGGKALVALQAKPADLVLLDIKMPRLDGFEVLERLRRASQVPVIFLTSKDEEEDELKGLALGGDDYIRKPFSQALLVARIRTLLRRAGADDAAVDEALPATGLVRGGLTLDQERHSCRWRGQDVTLTATEFLIVKALALRPGHVKSRDQLLDAAYGDGGYVDDRTIDSHIKRLRRKFKALDEEFGAIETLYGIGYRFNAS